MNTNRNRCSGRRTSGAMSLMVLVLSGAAVRLPAQEPADADQADQLRQMVADVVPLLAADLRADRVAAEKRLLEAGPDVLVWLPVPETIGDAATREALRRIRAELEWRAAQASVEPGEVTLRGTMTLDEIVGRIGRQTGNSVAADESIAGAELDADYRNVPFWEVIDDLSHRLRRPAVIPDGRQTVVLGPADIDSVLDRVTAGAFRVEFLSWQPRGRTVGVELAVTGEPRLRPLFLSWSDGQFTARIPSGALHPFSPEAERELPAVDRGPLRFSVVFEHHGDLPQQPATVNVTGSVVVTTAATTREFRFRNLLDSASESQHSGGVTVTRKNAEFSTTRQGIRRAEIELGVAYSAGGPAFESHRTWVYHNEVYLEAPDGGQFPVNDGFDTLAEQNGAVAVRYRFRDLPELPPEDWQLVYHAPTAVIEVPVEFEFKDASISPDPGA